MSKNSCNICNNSQISNYTDWFIFIIYLYNKELVSPDTDIAKWKSEISVITCISTNQVEIIKNTNM